MSLDEVYTKLKNEVAAAERLREKYGLTKLERSNSWDCP